MFMYMYLWIIDNVKIYCMGDMYIMWWIVVWCDIFVFMVVFLLLFFIYIFYFYKWMNKMRRGNINVGRYFYFNLIYM